MPDVANGHGSFTYGGTEDVGPVLWRDAARIVVCRYDDTKTAPKCYTVLPNVQCDAINYMEGLEPPTAKFRYVLDDTAEVNRWPTQYEEIFAAIENVGGGKSRDAARRAAYVAKPDDRIVVLCFQDPEDADDYEVLFDGFAEAPELGVDPANQSVTFDASDVSIRLFDEPIHRRSERDASDPLTPGASSLHWVDGVATFNPGGKGNCTLMSDAYMESADDSVVPGNSWPVFVDPSCFDRSPKAAQRWTLSGLACYLMGTYNDEEFVDNPDFSIVRDLIKNRVPLEGVQFFDPDDSATYTEEDIDVVEYNATGKRWPEALREQLGYSGFGTKLVCERGDDGKPYHRIEIYRKDGTGIGEPLVVSHQDARLDLDPESSNVSGLQVTRDYKSAYNAVIVDTKPTLWEVSVVLAPGFEPAVGDETPENVEQWKKSKQSDASGTTRAKYRRYIADECGEGHWDREEEWTTTPLDLTPIWPDDEAGFATYCKRLRPGRETLNSVDTTGRPLKADLAFSRDYFGFVGCLWNGDGKWQPIAGGWKLLRDRLGIEVTADDPEAWSIGEYGGDDPQEMSKVLAGVTSIANPNDKDKYFYLRLTTVIESDTRPVGVIAARPSSILKYDRVLFAGAKQHFSEKKIAAGSLYNSTGLATIVKEEETAIRDFGAQVQQAHENPAIAGRVVIPWLDFGYPIGDVVSKVKGRDLSLQVNAGVEQGEAERYPTIVGVTYEFTGKQATILQLSDHRADPR